MKCLLLINKSSGNSSRIDKTKIMEKLSSRYTDIKEREFCSKDDVDFLSISTGFDAVAVCGGDGTFNNALNELKNSQKELIYIPSGTFNDCFKALKKSTDKDSGLTFGDFYLGECNEHAFSYVTATGSFTPIGYKPKENAKKIFKRMVYYAFAFKEYKLWDIKAKININSGKKFYDDTFTLIMAVKSKFVFGFPFNRIHKHGVGGGELLLIKTPKGAFRYIKMFFLFFRAFFIGFNKEYESNNIIFANASNVDIITSTSMPYCVDGERLDAGKTMRINFDTNKIKLGIIR